MQVLLLFWAIFHLLVYFLGPKWGDMHLTLREGNVRQTWDERQAQKSCGELAHRGREGAQKGP